MDILKLLLFLSLLCGGHCYIKAVGKIATLLIKSFLEHSSASKDLITTENEFKRVQFDNYKEQLSTSTMEGLDINYFDQVVDEIASDFSISSQAKKAILRGKHARQNEQVLKEFVLTLAKQVSFCMAVQ